MLWPKRYELFTWNVLHKYLLGLAHVSNAFRLFADFCVDALCTYQHTHISISVLFCQANVPAVLCGRVCCYPPQGV